MVHVRILVQNIWNFDELFINMKPFLFIRPYELINNFDNFHINLTCGYKKNLSKMFKNVWVQLQKKTNIKFRNKVFIYNILHFKAINN